MKHAIILALCAIIDPSQWGLNQIISTAIATLASYLIGLFTVKPSFKSKSDNGSSEPKIDTSESVSESDNSTKN